MNRLREELANALHEAIDGDFLVGASMSKPGEDVALTKARVSEVVWWAVDAVQPVVATVDQRARTEALSSAADAWQQGAWSDVLDLRSLGTKAMGTAQRVTDWLRARSKLQ